MSLDVVGSNTDQTEENTDESNSILTFNLSVNFSQALTNSNNEDREIGTSPLNGMYFKREAHEGLLSEAGIPASRNIKPDPSLLEGHPLSRILGKAQPLTSSDLQDVFHTVPLSISGYPTGVVPAAVRNQQSENGHSRADDYHKNFWIRDSTLVSFIMDRAGFQQYSSLIRQNIWGFSGAAERRGAIVGFHLQPDSEAQKRFSNCDGIPQVKLSIGEDRNVKPCDHGWGHKQIDAWGAALYLPYQFANLHLSQGGDASEHAHRYLLGLDPIKDSPEHIIPSTLKTLNRIRVWDQSDLGPWEDFEARSRGGSIGIVYAALQQAYKYHEKMGWDALPIQYGFGREGDASCFRSEVTWAMARCRDVLRFRVPESGYAIECERRPHDCSLIFLLFPYEAGLTLGQEHSILRTVYRNMGPYGFRRWEHDHHLGADGFVGQDYHYNTDPHCKGEFADNKVEGYEPAQWTIFDPLLAAYYFRRYISSGGLDTESFHYANSHLKRALAFLTTSEEEIFVKGKNQTFHIPSLVLPEARHYDSKEERWRPNHNTPLLMAQAALGMALERAIEATLLWERSLIRRAA